MFIRLSDFLCLYKCVVPCFPLVSSKLNGQNLSYVLIIPLQFFIFIQHHLNSNILLWLLLVWRTAAQWMAPIEALLNMRPLKSAASHRVNLNTQMNTQTHPCTRRQCQENSALPFCKYFGDIKWQEFGKKKFNYWNLCAKACGKLKKRREKRAIVRQRGVIKAINMLWPVRDLKNAKIRAHVQVTVVSVYNCVQKIKTYKLAANLCSPVSG